MGEGYGDLGTLAMVVLVFRLSAVVASARAQHISHETSSLLASNTIPCQCFKYRGAAGVLKWGILDVSRTRSRVLWRGGTKIDRCDGRSHVNVVGCEGNHC